MHTPKPGSGERGHVEVGPQRSSSQRCRIHSMDFYLDLCVFEAVTVRKKDEILDKDHVLWDRNPGFLKSEIGPFSDFKRKSYLMDLKSAHSQESDFPESGEVDRFLKMGAHFQERSGSLENGLCVIWSGFWLRPGYLWLSILVAVKQIYDQQITRRLVAQRVAPAARVILSQTPSFRRWRLFVETMAYWQQVPLSLPRCSYLFVLQRPRTLVPT